MAGDIGASYSSFTLNITNSANQLSTTKNYNSNISIGQLKNRLELLTGCSCQTMQLMLYNDNNEFIKELVGDYESLENAAKPAVVSNNWRIHVEDKSPHIDLNVESVPKYEISEEEYASRQDSALKFMAQHRIGKFKPVDPEEEKRKEEELRAKEDMEKEKALGMKVGDRCEVCVPKQPVRRGAVQFVGEVHFKPGYWVGVRYDEPVGKNNGTVEGKSYFECPPKYGGMVRPSQVVVGDYPELGLDDLDEI